MGEAGRGGCRLHERSATPERLAKADPAPHNQCVDLDRAVAQQRGRGDIRMRMRVRPDPYQVLATACIGGSVLLSGQYVFVAVTLAAVAVIILLESVFIRVSADRNGIRVQNWLPETIPWSGVSKIEILPRSFWGAQKVQITLSNGRRVRPWAAKTGYKSGHDYAQIERLVGRLDLMRRDVLGISDPPQLAKALAAARAGDPAPIDDLLATGVIHPALYQSRLHELAETGQLDLEALRRRRRETI